MNSVCVLIRKAPYGTENSFAGLKLALATIANGIETRVVLLEDGVFNAVKHQDPEKIGMPSIVDTIFDLLSLDVHIYCIEEHLKARNIEKEQLIDELKNIGENSLPKIILDCDVITAF